jgi:hypothetical protein
VPCLWVVSFWTRGWPFATIAAAMSAFMVHDAWSLIQTKRAAQKQEKCSTKKGLK